MDGDKSGESGAFLFSRRVPDFWDGRRSFATNGNTNMYRSGTSAMDFAHYQSPKLLGFSPPITQVSIFGTLSISGQINRENLRQTCRDYPIYLGRSAKSKIPDRLGSSRLLKTRLKSFAWLVCRVVGFSQGVNKPTTRETTHANDFVNAKSHAREKPLLAGYLSAGPIVWVFGKFLHHETEKPARRMGRAISKLAYWLAVVVTCVPCPCQEMVS